MWKDAVVTPDMTIKATLRVINEHACRIAFVVDKNNKLIGIVTDGDVRRGLLADLPLEEKVISITNKSPIICIEEEATLENVSKIINDNHILNLPIVDTDNHLINVFTYDNLERNPKKDNPVFIMAGGFGTRLRPLTDNCPKPMLKIGKLPILEHTLNRFIENGFHKFYFSTHYLAEQIRDYFGDGSKWGVSIGYIHEEQPLGTGGALGLLPKDEIKLPMIVINGDVMTKINFGHLVDFHTERKSIATICVREYVHNVPFGVIGIDGYYVQSMIEKPSHRSFINAGIYVLDPDVVKAVPFDKKVDLPTVLQGYMDQGEKVSSFPIHEYWLDVGRIADFELAQRDVASGMY
tara:strand:+ start:8620 stop:9669 length:1050 start_codon:yes stop_codon:yes gene_type:complete